MKLTITFNNHFFGHNAESVQFLDRHVPSRTSQKVAMTLYNGHAQALFNYGMQLCAGETVKSSIATLFIEIEKNETTLASWTEAKLFKLFREILKRQTPQIMRSSSLSSDGTGAQTEAVFLKLRCHFTYEEIAAIMGVRKESAYTLVSQALRKASDKK